MNDFSWNPIFNLVIQVKRDYEKIQKEFNFIDNSLDFKKMVETIGDELYDQIFSYLIINQYNEFILIKYENMAELYDEFDNETFWDYYNGIFQECRSIVINLKTEEIVLCPQKKFFNIGERKEWEIKNIKNKINNCKKFEISSKLDGSNQNARWYNNQVFMSGSMALDENDSWRLQEGKNLLTENYISMLKDYPDYTFMFEYISPKNQIVVKYTKEQEGLYLFGMRNVYTGKEKSYEETLFIGHKYEVKTTEVFNKTLDDIIGELDLWKANEKEGWVINIIDENDDNFKAKLKVNDYVQIHKVIGKLSSPNLILRSIANNQFDDILSRIPDAYKELAREYAKEVRKYQNFIKANVDKYVSIVKNLNRKEAMIWMDANISKDFLGYCKNEYLGKEWNCLKKTGDGYKKYIEIKKFNEKYIKGDLFYVS